MAESLSSVPPVWPSPRPEIIGTKAPQAATIGASIRLTLSPTPPLECLSITGPGSAEARSSRASTPDRIRPSVSATRSAVVMPRKNTAMAKAATWPSLRLPSCDAAGDEGDLLGRQLLAVALLADDLLRQHAAQA